MRYKDACCRAQTGGTHLTASYKLARPQAARRTVNRSLGDNLNSDLRSALRSCHGERKDNLVNTSVQGGLCTVVSSSKELKVADGKRREMSRRRRDEEDRQIQLSQLVGRCWRRLLSCGRTVETGRGASTGREARDW